MASVLGGRLPPEEWYPAGERELTVRRVQLSTSEFARVIEGGPPGRTPVLLVHGWGCSVYFFRKLIPALMASGRRVVAVDLRGHGGSDKPRDERLYSAPQMAANLEDLLATLDLPRVHVVAHSLGGGVVLDVAAGSDRFASITLLAPVGLAPLRFIPLARIATPLAAAGLVPYAAPRWSVPLVLRAVYGKLGEHVSRDVDEYWAPTADPDFALALHSLLHRYDFGPRSDEQLRAIAAPMLILLGSRDLLVRSRMSLARATATPGVTVRMIDRAGHVLAEEAPEQVLSELLPHLARNS